MEYQRTYQATQPYTNPQTDQICQLDPTYVGNFLNTESGNNLPCFPIHQPSFYPISNSDFSTNYLEDCSWPTQDTTLGLPEAVLDPLLQIQPVPQIQAEPHADEQSSRQTVARLEGRVSKIEERVDRLEDKFGGLEDRISWLKGRLSEPEGLMQNLRSG
jgi:hypothetical protein